MEVGELKVQEPQSSMNGRQRAFLEGLKLSPWSSQSSADAGINDSAKQLKHALQPTKYENAQHWDQSAAVGCDDNLLREPSSSGALGQNGGISVTESAMYSSFDPGKLFSIAAQPPSETGVRSQLNTQAAFFDAEENFSSQLAIAEDNPHGAGSSSWKSQKGRASDQAKKLPIEDSALEADHAGGGTDALEKLWPLMAAVQRRQTSSSCPTQNTSAPAFRLTSAYPSEARPAKLTRAQAEFLGTPRPKAMSLSSRSIPNKQSGFFSRQTSSPSYTKSLGRERHDSLRLLDSRKERRMDPQERLRLWLEQGEPYFLSCAAPDWEKHNELPGPSRSVLLQTQKRPKARQKPTPLERLFSCFAM